MPARKGPTILAVSSLAIGWALAAIVLSTLWGFHYGALPYANGDDAYQFVVTYDHKTLNGLAAGTPVQLTRRARIEMLRQVVPPEFGLVTQAGTYRRLSVGGDREATGLAVSADWFHALGTPVQLGRPITIADSVANNRLIALVSDRYWRNDLGTSRTIVGSMLFLDGVGYEIIGVMPPAFRAPTDETDFWVPLDLTRAEWTAADACCISAIVMGAKNPADRDLVAQRAAVAWNTAAPSRDGTMHVRLDPLRAVLTRQSFVRHLVPLAGSVAGGILLVGLFNFGVLALLANLVRARDLGIRTALGASPARLAGGLVARIQLSVVVSCAVGTAIAWWIVGNTQILSTTIFPGWLQARVDWRIALAMTALTSLVGLVAALPSVITARRTELMPLLKLGATGGTLGKRVSGTINGLVFAELAFTVLFLPFSQRARSSSRERGAPTSGSTIRTSLGDSSKGAPSRQARRKQRPFLLTLASASPSCPAWRAWRSPAWSSSTGRTPSETCQRLASRNDRSLRRCPWSGSDRASSCGRCRFASSQAGHQRWTKSALERLSHYCRGRRPTPS